MSFGVQRQLRHDMAIEVDYVHNREPQREGAARQRQPDATTRATGVEPAVLRTARNRLYPNFGPIGYYAYTGRSDYHGLQTDVHQAVQQPVAGLGELHAVADQERRAVAADQRPARSCRSPVAPDLGGEYGLAVTDQRHRAVFNGIWQVGYGFQVSGLYFFGSGERQETVCGGDRRDSRARRRPDGCAAGSGWRVPDRVPGSSSPRNNFVQDPIHRVDMRLQQRIPLGGRVSVDGILEVFNVFDRANYGSYVTDRSSPLYGQPNRARTSRTRRGRCSWASG